MMCWDFDVRRFLHILCVVMEVWVAYLGLKKESVTLLYFEVGNQRKMPSCLVSPQYDGIGQKVILVEMTIFLWYWTRDMQIFVF